VEIYISEYPLQLAAVGIFHVFQSGIDQFTYIGSITVIKEIIKSAAFRHLKAFIAQGSFHTHHIMIVFLSIEVFFVLPYIRYILYKKHSQDIVLVLRWINDTPESVTGFPNNVVDFALGNWFIAHASDKLSF